jgi:threonine/homoserine/homoserine lactone efflux protein
MTTLLPTGAMLAAFVVACLVLAITPGPAVLYIVTRSLTQGRRSGLASVAGVALGNLGNAVGASVGLAALLAISSAAFLAVKYAGAAYLIYLGIQAWRAPVQASQQHALPAVPLRRIFRDGFIVALLNPKTALFFAAFLPQFMHAQTASVAQSIVLGAMFVTVAVATDTLYALGASAVAPTLTRSSALRPIGRYLGAGVYFGLGLFTALTGSRSSR